MLVLMLTSVIWILDRHLTLSLINLLLVKLKSIYLNDRTVNWIASFLAKRTQRVTVDGSLSDIVDVTSEVPLGSVIGPILFLIYIHDLPKVLHFSKCVMFVDDGRASSVGLRSDVTFRENFQRGFDSIVDWSERWLLLLNVKKCNVMHLGRRSVALGYTLRGSPLEVVSEYRDLGVTIDNALIFY